MDKDRQLLLQSRLQAYYAAIDPDERQKHLEDCAELLREGSGEGAAGSAAADPAASYRQDLFAARHINQKDPAKKVDRFLGTLMNLLTIVHNPGLFPKWHRREVLSMLRRMELDGRPCEDSACEEALYLEYRNVVRRFFSTCADSAYAAKLFGLAHASAQDRERQRCIDTWEFSYGIAGMVGLEKEMALLCRAANDEYCASVPEAASLEEAYRALTGKS